MSDVLHMAPRPGDRWLVPGDLHFPYNDRAATRIMIEIAEHYGVTQIILQGDTFDTYALSKYDKSAAKLVPNSLEREAASAASFLAWCRTRPDTVFIPGNHEDRVNSFVGKHPELSGTLTISKAFGLQGFTVLSHGAQIRAHSMVIEHGDVLLKGRGLASKVLQKAPHVTTIYGHFHTLDMSRLTTYDKHGRPVTHAAYGVGHLAALDAHHEWAERYPNWQQGFVLVEWAPPNFQVTQVEIHRDKTGRAVARFDGRTFRG